MTDGCYTRQESYRDSGGESNKRLKLLCLCLAFMLPTIGLDWLSNRSLNILLIFDFFFLNLLYGALWNRKN